MEYSLVTRGAGGLFNDFYDYWGAGVLLNRGQNPYDVAALAAVQRSAGLQVEPGSGYSYPLFFAHLLRPLALLDPHTSAIIFSALSLLALTAAIALLLGSIPAVSWPVALLGGAAAGIFPPVNGSLYFGQANLIVLLMLALAYRCVAPGPTLGLAGAVKLYPVSGFLAAITERPPAWRSLRNGIGVFILLLLLQIGPSLGAAGRAGFFALGPDTYWSNESINGWISRLGLDSTWTRAPLPGLSVAGVMVAIVGLLTIGTIVLLLRVPERPWSGALALSVWLGVIGAPKNSLWNFTPLLLCLVFTWLRLGGRWWILGGGLLGWLLIEAQAQLDAARETVYRASPALAWLSSVGLYGALLIGGLTAYVLLRPGGARPPPRPPSR